jgi:hypothetical protein
VRPLHEHDHHAANGHGQQQRPVDQDDAQCNELLAQHVRVGGAIGWHVHHQKARQLFSIKDIAQPGFLAVTIASMAMVRIHEVRPLLFVLGRCRWAGHGGRRGPLDEFVKLAPIQPDASALRAVIDFDTLTLAHHQRHVWTRGAFHESTPKIRNAHTLHHITLSKKQHFANACIE